MNHLCGANGESDDYKVVVQSIQNEVERRRKKLEAEIARYKSS